ncbi:MAG: slipin family protein, partial [Proteobacteria bacterium]|nr:slipin family protein [Pseudomonadota bacterium]
MVFEMEYFGIALVLMAGGLLFSMFRVLREYERGVIFM